MTCIREEEDVACSVLMCRFQLLFNFYLVLFSWTVFLGCFGFDKSVSH